jgi:hypothetical protein
VRFVELEGWYMGGHPAGKAPVQATLSIDDERLTVADLFSDEGFIVEPWRNVTGLFVQGPDAAETRFTDARPPTDLPLGRAAFGAALWNLWWLKKKKSASFIVVQGTFGDFVFEVMTKSPERLRTKVALCAGRINGPTNDVDVAATCSTKNHGDVVGPASAPGRNRFSTSMSSP